MRRGLRFFGSLAAAVLCVSGFSGCGARPDAPCFDGPCNCFPGSSCFQACNQSPCNLGCAGFDSDCQSTCVDSCTVTCHDGPNCATSCGKDCNVTCDHVSDCSAECGASCHYTCQNTGNCAPHVGDGSEVLCQSVSDCNVECRGACRVRCVSVGNCNVDCKEGGNRQQCSDGWACGRACD